MHEAERLVERLGVDRQTRPCMLYEHAEHLVSLGIHRHGDNIGARHAHIIHLEGAHVTKIDEHVARPQRFCGGNGAWFRLVRLVTAAVQAEQACENRV